MYFNNLLATFFDFPGINLADIAVPSVKLFNFFRIDIKAGYFVTCFAEFYNQREADIAESDDADS